MPLYRLTHRSRLDYGWRVGEVVLYDDMDCSGAVKYKDIKVSPFPETFTSGDTKTLITDITSVYTGEFGNAFYPHSRDPNKKASDDYEYGNSNLFDGTDKNTASEWWSACLNCNPEEVDSTHNGAVEIVIAVKGEKAVQCVGL